MGVNGKMTNEKDSSRRFFDSASVSKAVGIPSIYLNKFIERKQYGIEPSVSAGEGRGSRRFFNESDVHGIALVWWLFEGGLRSQTIQEVLDQICGGKKKSTAAEAAVFMFEDVADLLAIKREPRIGFRKSQRQQPVEVIPVISQLGSEYLVEQLDMESLLYIPTGQLFEKLEDSMQKYGVAVAKS